MHVDKSNDAVIELHKKYVESDHEARHGFALQKATEFQMPHARIDHLILNSPYREPDFYWAYDRETRTFSTAPGRRSAGYIRATPDSKAFDDPGVFIELALVNLVLNARDAMPLGGTLSIEGRRVGDFGEITVTEGRSTILPPLY